MKSALQAATGEVFLLLAFVAMLSASEGTGQGASASSAATQAAVRIDPTKRKPPDPQPENAADDGLRRQRLVVTGGHLMLDGVPISREALEEKIGAQTDTVRIEGLLSEDARGLLRALAARGVAIELE